MDMVVEVRRDAILGPVHPPVYERRSGPRRCDGLEALAAAALRDLVAGTGPRQAGDEDGRAQEDNHGLLGHARKQRHERLDRGEMSRQVDRSWPTRLVEAL